jgi:hypothetical protein
MTVIAFPRSKRQRNFLQRLDGAYAAIRASFMALYPDYAEDDIAVCALLQIAADVLRAASERPGFGGEWTEHMTKGFLERAKVKPAG